MPIALSRTAASIVSDYVTARHLGKFFTRDGNSWVEKSDCDDQISAWGQLVIEEYLLDSPKFRLPDGQLNQRRYMIVLDTLQSEAVTPEFVNTIKNAILQLVD